MFAADAPLDMLGLQVEARLTLSGTVRRKPMRRHLIPLALLLTLTIGCGGSGMPVSSTGISGAYEFVVTSNITGGTTLVEANLAAGGSASGPTKVQILTQENKAWYLNGVCFGATPGQNGVSSNISGSNIAVTFNEGGNTFTGQGTLVGNMVSGNYTVNNSKCPDLIGVPGFVPAGYDSGGFTGSPVPALSGSFSGTLTLPDGADNAVLTLTEAGNRDLTVSAVLSGPTDNGTFAFSGTAVGNVMLVSGTINGNTLSLFGYFDSAGTYTGIANSLLVFNYGTQVNAGLLLKQ
jgi:hypothetical protein